MPKDPFDKLFSVENMVEIRRAINTKGVNNVELLCYVALTLLDMVMEQTIEENQNAKKV